MLRMFALACLIGAALPVGLFAAAPPAAPRTVRVLGLIEQLGHRDYRMRDLAQRRLLDDAPAALPLVRQALGHRNREVRQRALRLLPTLEDGVFFAPRRVTLSVREQGLYQVLEQLSKATGYRVVVNGGWVGGPNQKFSFDFTDVPFWDAVDRICRAARLNVQQSHSWGNEQVTLQSGGPSAHVRRCGAFRCAAQGLQLHRSLDLGPGGARTDNLTFTFQIASEPRLPFVRVDPPRLTAAYDEHRAALLAGDVPFQERGSASLAGGIKPLAATVNVNLKRRSTRATMLKVLRGVVPAEVLVSQKPVVLATKVLEAKGQKAVAGDMEFTITQAKKENNLFHVHLDIKPQRKMGTNWTHYLYYRFELFDEKGNKLSWQSAGAGGWLERAHVNMTYPLARKDCTPMKLAFLVWQTRRYEVPFEFHDVPLP